MSNIGFDVDKDRAGKYDMTLDEVTADLGPNSADGKIARMLLRLNR